MRKTFDDLVFKEHPVSHDGVQALMNIGKYEISVVNLNGQGAPFELAIYNAKGNFVQLPGIHKRIGDYDDVIHYLSPSDITAIMLKLETIQRVLPKKVDSSSIR